MATARPAKTQTTAMASPVRRRCSVSGFVVSPTSRKRKVFTPKAAYSQKELDRPPGCSETPAPGGDAHREARGDRGDRAGEVELLGPDERGEGERRRGHDLRQRVLDAADDEAAHQSERQPHDEASDRGETHLRGQERHGHGAATRRPRGDGRVGDQRGAVVEEALAVHDAAERRPGTGARRKAKRMETVSVTERMQPRSSAGPQRRSSARWSAPPVAPMATTTPRWRGGRWERVGAYATQVGGEAALEEERRQTHEEDHLRLEGAAPRAGGGPGDEQPPTTSATL